MMVSLGNKMGKEDLLTNEEIIESIRNKKGPKMDIYTYYTFPHKAFNHFSVWWLKPKWHR